MNEDTQACPDCGAAYVIEDNYCRQCGMYLAALRQVPVVKAQSSVPAKIERERATLPAPVKKAATALAIGTALQIGVGIAGKYVASQAARQAARAALSANHKKPSREPVKADEPVRAVSPLPPQETTAVSETVMIRRVWIRRSE